MSHIIGRPDDNLLDIMLGPDAEPEQAIIGATQHVRDDVDDQPIDDASPAPER